MGQVRQHAPACGGSALLVVILDGHAQQEVHQGLDALSRTVPSLTMVNTGKPLEGAARRGSSGQPHSSGASRPRFRRRRARTQSGTVIFDRHVPREAGSGFGEDGPGNIGHDRAANFSSSSRISGRDCRIAGHAPPNEGRSRRRRGGRRSPRGPIGLMVFLIRPAGSRPGVQSRSAGHRQREPEPRPASSVSLPEPDGPTTRTSSPAHATRPPCRQTAKRNRQPIDDGACMDEGRRAIRPRGGRDPSSPRHPGWTGGDQRHGLRHRQPGIGHRKGSLEHERAAHNPRQGRQLRRRPATPSPPHCRSGSRHARCWAPRRSRPCPAPWRPRAAARRTGNSLIVMPSSWFSAISSRVSSSWLASTMASPLWRDERTISSRRATVAATRRVRHAGSSEARRSVRIDLGERDQAIHEACAARKRFDISVLPDAGRVIHEADHARERMGDYRLG